MIYPSATSFRLFLTAAIVLVGCGPHIPQRKACVPVRGKLLVRSQPAAGAMVYLRPEDGSRAEDWGSGFPRARVAADGSFSVTTYTSGDGAPPGEYRLLVEWFDRSATPGDDDEAEGEGDIAADAEDRLGSRYLDPATTPLRATVNAEGTELPVINIP